MHQGVGSPLFGVFLASFSNPGGGCFGAFRDPVRAVLVHFSPVLQGLEMHQFGGVRPLEKCTKTGGEGPRTLKMHRCIFSTPASEQLQWVVPSELEDNCWNSPLAQDPHVLLAARVADLKRL